MPQPTPNDTQRRVRLWIRRNTKENSRLEFKLRVDLSTPGAKAEFIRDVIALANSEGEHPRSEGYLVIGFKKGRYHNVKDEHYDGATFGQILDSYISPPVDTAYEEFGNVSRGRVGVLLVRPTADTLYVVSKRLLDDKGQSLLAPGQCWGRRSDRKIEFNGETIQNRFREIIERKVEQAAGPLRSRIDKLEREGGPAFEVKRIRFAMQAARKWEDLETQLDKLAPYASEFDHVVKNEVVDALLEATGRTRQGMPLSVAQSVDAVLGQLMPVGFGGMHYRSRKEILKDDLNLLQRIGHATFELTWDACRYLRDIAIVDIGARRYWYLIRFATLNGLKQLQADFLKDARYCAYISMEERREKAFPEAQQKLRKEIADALDAFECEGYSITTASPRELGQSDVAACVAVLKIGDAVNWRSAKNELPLARSLAIARKGGQIVGVGAIKRERREYAADIAEKSGVDFPPETPELGYVAVAPDHRGHHLSHCIVRSLLQAHDGRLFATTYSDYMKSTLTRFGFVNKGKEWKGRRDMLSFWEKE